MSNLYSENGSIVADGDVNEWEKSLKREKGTLFSYGVNISGEVDGMDYSEYVLFLSSYVEVKWTRLTVSRVISPHPEFGEV